MIVSGALVSVEEKHEGSVADAPASIGETEVLLRDATHFRETGICQIGADDDAASYVYTLDEDGLTLLLEDPLTVAVEDGTPVYSLSDTSTSESQLFVHVQVTEGQPPVRAAVPSAARTLALSDSLLIGGPTEVESTVDGYRLVSLPFREPVIDGDIEGATITGGLFRTAPDGRRVQLEAGADYLEAGGIYFYLADPPDVRGHLEMVDGFTPFGYSGIRLRTPTDFSTPNQFDVEFVGGNGADPGIMNVQGRMYVVDNVEMDEDLRVWGPVDVHGTFTGHGTVTGETVRADGGTLGNDNWIGGGTTDAEITTGGSITRKVSSRRFKKSIKPLSLTKIRDGVRGLNPVSFLWRDSDEKGGERHPGFIAEEVADADLGMWVTRDSDGKVEGVRYPELTAALTLLVQDLYDIVEDQQGQIDRLARRLGK